MKSDSTIRIELGPRFGALQFDNLISSRDSLPSQWEQSFLPETSNVVFDLSITEWVTTDGITFLFAWIRNLHNLEKKVRVALPISIELNKVLSSNVLKDLGTKYADGEVRYADDYKRLERRKRSSAFLMIVYGMLDKIGLKQNDFDNMMDRSTYNRLVGTLKGNDHQIIPFTYLEVATNSRNQKSEGYVSFNDGNLNVADETTAVFKLQGDIEQLLRSYACYSPFESRILSNVITHELYINSSNHAIDKDVAKFRLSECYLTAFLFNKAKQHRNEFLSNIHRIERYPEVLDFFKDKDHIKALMLHTLQREGTKQIKPTRFADLSKFDDFKNNSFLEYSFLDFGVGIPTTLRSQFIKHREAIIANNFVSPGFQNTEEDSQILEYAFHLDSSQNPLKRDIDDSDLIPRGLYFLIDMVRRYKGLLVCRSGRGFIAFDFSDRLFLANESGKPLIEVRPTTAIQDAIRFSNVKRGDFPGTVYSIVLPEKKDDKLNEPTIMAPVRIDERKLSEYAYAINHKTSTDQELLRTQFKPDNFDYISVLFMYNNVIETLKSLHFEISVQMIYDRLFHDINQVLDKYRDRSYLLFFDFAGLKSGNSSWIKILYFLMNTPKVNEYTKVVIVNLPSDEGKIVSAIKTNLRGKDYPDRSDVRYVPFLYRPIPCLNFNYYQNTPTVTWIGLKDEEDEILLTGLLMGRKSSYPLSNFRFPANLEGSIFYKEISGSGQWLHTTYSGIEDMKEIFLKKQKEAITSYLLKYIYSGESDGEKKKVFFASNGSFQYAYLSMYEILHDKYVARYFAKSLLDKYCDYVRSNVINNTSIENLAFSEEKYYRFNKMIAVTVSSQLLGVAIRDLIEDDNNYSFLRDPLKRDGGVNSSPELIMLSSYYSFDSEKPFEKVKEDDRVLIVNDVVSTGNLVEKLFRQIEDVKRAYVCGVFSIADTRIPEWLIEDPVKEVHSTYFSDGQREQRFFSLSSAEDKLIIRKYKGPINASHDSKRINPLLNSVVELKAQHGEQNKILFSDPASIINDSKISDQYFRVGHYKQNLTHNAYLTNMRDLFASSEGVYLIQLLKDEIEKSFSVYSNGDNIRIKVANIRNELRAIKEVIGSEAESLLSTIVDNLSELQQAITIDSSSRKSKKAFNPDYIFYPVFSGIERIPHADIANIFKTHVDNIIGLQRFDTPKGWRFPFPAKRFNHLTKNKKILILDSGSLTGESLVQLIDNIGFLEVSEITVLSIITRVEDFYREFYSRLKSVRVKHLRTSAEDKTEETIVPINVMFGLSLHIPVYSSAIACPFCEETRRLHSILKTESFALNDEVKQYISFRTNEIAEINNAKEDIANISYLPRKNDGTNAVDTKGIFLTRDRLGKIDSYRFYPEYFTHFNNFQNRIASEPGFKDSVEYQIEIEQILACILHEPSLLDLIRNYLNGLVPDLKGYLKQRVFGKRKRKPFYYRWSDYSKTLLIYTILKDDVFILANFEELLASEEKEVRLFLYFKFWEIFYLLPDHPDVEQVGQLLVHFQSNYNREADPIVYNAANRDFVKLFVNRLSIQKLDDYSFLDIPFKNISSFVAKGENKGRHFELTDLLNDLFMEAESSQHSRERLLEILDNATQLLEPVIRPSLLIIKRNRQLKDYFEELFSTFCGEENSFLFYVEKLLNLKSQVNSLTREDDSGFYVARAEISDVCEQFINRILANSEKSRFYYYAKLYPSNFFESWDNLKGHGVDPKNCELNLIPDDTIIEGKALYLNIHKTILEEILKEIIKNAKKAYDKDLVLSCHLTVDVEKITLTIKQNKCFTRSDRAGGKANLVEHFVNQFRGVYSDNAKESAELGIPFIINMEIPLFSIKSEDPSLVNLF